MTTSDNIIFYGGGAWGQALAIALSNCNSKAWLSCVNNWSSTGILFVLSSDKLSIITRTIPITKKIRISFIPFINQGNKCIGDDQALSWIVVG